MRRRRWCATSRKLFLLRTMPGLSSHLSRLLLSTSSLSALEVEVKNLLLVAALDVGGPEQDETIPPSDEQSSIVEEDLPAGPAGADLFATSRAASSVISLGEGRGTSSPLAAQQETKNEEEEVAGHAAIQLNDLDNNDLDALTVEKNLEELLYAEQNVNEDLGRSFPEPDEDEFFGSGSSTSSSVGILDENAEFSEPEEDGAASSFTQMAGSKPLSFNKRGSSTRKSNPSAEVGALSHASPGSRTSGAEAAAARDEVLGNSGTGAGGDHDFSIFPDDEDDHDDLLASSNLFPAENEDVGDLVLNATGTTFLQNKQTILLGENQGEALSMRKQADKSRMNNGKTTERREGDKDDEKERSRGRTSRGGGRNRSRSRTSREDDKDDRRRRPARREGRSRSRERERSSATRRDRERPRSREKPPARPPPRPRRPPPRPPGYNRGPPPRYPPPPGPRGVPPPQEQSAAEPAPARTTRAKSKPKPPPVDKELVRDEARTAVQTALTQGMTKQKEKQSSYEQQSSSKTAYILEKDLWSAYFSDSVRTLANLEILPPVCPKNCGEEGMECSLEDFADLELRCAGNSKPLKLADPQGWLHVSFDGKPKVQTLQRKNVEVTLATEAKSRLAGLANWFSGTRSEVAKAELQDTFKKDKSFHEHLVGVSPTQFLAAMLKSWKNAPDPFGRNGFDPFASQETFLNSLKSGREFCWFESLSMMQFGTDWQGDWRGTGRNGKSSLPLYPTPTLEIRPGKECMKEDKDILQKMNDAKAAKEESWHGAVQNRYQSMQRYFGGGSTSEEGVIAGSDKIPFETNVADLVFLRPTDQMVLSPKLNMREFRLFTGNGKFASIQVEVLGEIRLYRSEGSNRAARPLFSKWYLAPGAGGNRQSPPNSQLSYTSNLLQGENNAQKMQLTVNQPIPSGEKCPVQLQLKSSSQLGKAEDEQFIEDLEDATALVAVKPILLWLLHDPLCESLRRTGLERTANGFDPLVSGEILPAASSFVEENVEEQEGLQREELQQEKEEKRSSHRLRAAACGARQGPGAGALGKAVQKLKALAANFASDNPLEKYQKFGTKKEFYVTAHSPTPAGTAPPATLPTPALRRMNSEMTGLERALHLLFDHTSKQNLFEGLKIAAQANHARARLYEKQLADHLARQNKAPPKPVPKPSWWTRAAAGLRNRFGDDKQQDFELKKINLEWDFDSMKKYAVHMLHPKREFDFSSNRPQDGNQVHADKVLSDYDSVTTGSGRNVYDFGPNNLPPVRLARLMRFLQYSNYGLAVAAKQKITPGSFPGTEPGLGPGPVAMIKDPFKIASPFDTNEILEGPGEKSDKTLILNYFKRNKIPMIDIQDGMRRVMDASEDIGNSFDRQINANDVKSQQGGRFQWLHLGWHLTATPQPLPASGTTAPNDVLYGIRRKAIGDEIADILPEFQLSPDTAFSIHEQPSVGPPGGTKFLDLGQQVLSPIPTTFHVTNFLTNFWKKQPVKQQPYIAKAILRDGFDEDNGWHDGIVVKMGSKKKFDFNEAHKPVDSFEKPEVAAAWYQALIASNPLASPRGPNPMMTFKNGAGELIFAKIAELLALLERSCCGEIEFFCAKKIETVMVKDESGEFAKWKKEKQQKLDADGRTALRGGAAASSTTAGASTTSDEPPFPYPWPVASFCSVKEEYVRKFSLAREFKDPGTGTNALDVKQYEVFGDKSNNSKPPSPTASLFTMTQRKMYKNCGPIPNPEARRSNLEDLVGDRLQFNTGQAVEDEKWIEAIRAVLPVIESAVRVYDEDYFHNLHHQNAHDYNLRASNPESSSSECKVNMNEKLPVAEWQVGNSNSGTRESNQVLMNPDLPASKDPTEPQNANLRGYLENENHPLYDGSFTSRALQPIPNFLMKIEQELDVVIADLAAITGLFGLAASRNELLHFIPTTRKVLQHLDELTTRIATIFEYEYLVLKKDVLEQYVELFQYAAYERVRLGAEKDKKRNADGSVVGYSGATATTGGAGGATAAAPAAAPARSGWSFPRPGGFR